MKPPSIQRNFIFLIFGLGLASPVFGATRSVQFVGTVINHSERLLTTDYPSVTACSVLAVNTGETPQRVLSISFSGFETPAGGGAPVLAQTMDPIQTRTGVYNPGPGVGDPGTAIDSPIGWTATTNIEPGGFFVAAHVLETANFDGKNINYCAGTLQVADANPSQPGSIVAVGSISYLQELMVVGGQFMGALYYSGSHFDPATVNTAATANVFANTAASAAGEAAPPLRETMQMNLYCATACMEAYQAVGPGAYNAVEAGYYCDAACGMQRFSRISGGHPGANVASMGDQAAGQMRNRNIMGFFQETLGASMPANQSPAYSSVQEVSAASAFSQRYLMMGLSSTCAPSNPIAVSASQTGGPSAAEGVFLHNPNITDTWPIDGATVRPSTFNMRAMLRTASPLYAGGHVMEMIVGPFNSICSGNQSYHDQGNTDFSHEDSIDADPYVYLGSANNRSKGPPERLYCAHHHNNSAPFGYVAGGVPFTINSGAAF